MTAPVSLQRAARTKANTGSARVGVLVGVLLCALPLAWWLLRTAPAAPALGVGTGIPVAATAAELATSVAAGRRVFVSLCSSCHQIGANAAAGFGPQLTGVVGRAAGATTDYAYSPAMKGAHLLWTEQNLAAYLRDPGNVVPGTRMRLWGLSDDEKIANLLAYLRSVK
ncbi:c-type cytochrome [Massilia sp. PWRC2]|uniref:c-type cytochrome n=1 Tax=Massilia sp. PWRC2 TaxID=2804626 RepID=UPI003CF7A532